MRSKKPNGTRTGISKHHGRYSKSDHLRQDCVKWTSRRKRLWRRILVKYAVENSDLLVFSSRDFQFSGKNSFTPLLYFVRNHFQSVQDCCCVLYWYMSASVIKAMKVRPVVCRKFWFQYPISATWTWRVTATSLFNYLIGYSVQRGPVVWEQYIASVFSCPRCPREVWERAGETLGDVNSSCTVESRIDPVENAMGLGWSHPRRPRGGQFGQENFQERARAGRGPGMLVLSN